MITRSIIRSAVAIAALSVCSVAPALAAQSGFYVGATLGQAKFDIKKTDFDAIAFNTLDSVSNSSMDDSDTAFSGVVGYRFSPYVAVEASYVDLGSATYKANGTLFVGGSFGFVPASLNVDISAKGPALAVVGSLPFGTGFDVHARTGVFFSKTELGAKIVTNLASGSDQLSANSQDFFYGLGLGFEVGQHWSFTADWQQYKDVGDKDETGEGDISSLTVGAFYRF